MPLTEDFSASELHPGADWTAGTTFLALSVAAFDFGKLTSSKISMMMMMMMMMMMLMMMMMMMMMMMALYTFVRSWPCTSLYDALV